jgi:hypothetical protein
MTTRNPTFRMGPWPLLAAALLLAAGLGACTADTSGTGPDTTAQGGTGAGGGTGATGTTTSTNLNADDDGDGYTVGQGDCNDHDPTVHPAVPEICDNGIDDNCNGATDTSEPDADGDGYGPCQGDCNDADPNVSPSAPETPDDGLDNNCDGVTDGDYDGDGYTVAEGDCNDDDAAINPGAVENCYDGIDNNCNGFMDAAEPDVDQDGYGPCQGDCDDGNPNVNPGQPELPNNGIDDNCDNLVDEDVDGDGWTVANGDCNDGDPNVNPAVLEICNNNVDDDCDGVTDSDCVTPCQIAELLRSSVGCTYYAIDANNDPIEGYDSLPYAIVVSNTDPGTTANVEVQIRSGNNWVAQQNAAVAPGTLHQFVMPDRHVNYTGLLVAGAYRVVSDLPVIAYQFQPIDGVSSYTSDASLLLPTSALDQYYYVVGWGKPSYGNAQLVFVASQDATTVTITPSQATAAGGSIPALSAGVPYTFPTQLNAGDFIQLEGTNASFTGTYLTADKPIAVFSNHWCANVPDLGCCCDHLEEQMIGLQTWGTTYVAARMPVRSSGTPDPTYWHVFASQDDTSISFIASPGVTGLPASPQLLNHGGFLTLGVSGTAQNPGDFIVTADKPILVMEYLTSMYLTNAGVNQAGDPAMTQAVPVEQFLDHYIVLVPVNWVYDYEILTKPVGATITMDGNPLPQSGFIPIDDGVHPVQWEVARVTAGDGVHELTGSAPFGVVIVGYDAYDSYAYPGGLDQQIINPIN